MLGTGTINDPFILQTPQDVHDIRNYLGSIYYFELGNNIDMSSWGNFTPIGSTSASNRFLGVLDGKNYAIENLTINNGNIMNTSFFVSIQSATIKNLEMRNVNISSTASQTSALFGEARVGASLISNCMISGNILGGSDSSSFGTILGTRIENCISTATITSSQSKSGIAYVSNSSGTKVVNTIFNGTLSGVGHYPITGSSAVHENVFYNSDKLKTTNKAGAIELTTAQFNESSRFSTFNTSIWAFQRVPLLKSFLPANLPQENGTIIYPFILRNSNDINEIRYYLNKVVYFELGNNIDMASWGNFDPIGANSDAAQRFKGHLDGKGFVIKNVTINTSATSGFFRYLENSTIKNLGFENLNVTITSGSGSGLFAGMTGTCFIDNCYLTGSVTAANGSACSFGILSSNSRLRNCYSEMEVVGQSNTGFIMNIAGLCIVNSTNSVINSYFNGTLIKRFANSNLYPISSQSHSNSYYNADKLSTVVVISTSGALTDEQFKVMTNFFNWDSTLWGHNGTAPFLKIFNKETAKSILIEVFAHAQMINSKLTNSKLKNIFNNAFAKPIASSISKSKKTLLRATSYLKDVVASTNMFKKRKQPIRSHVSPITSKSFGRMTLKQLIKVLSYAAKVDSKALIYKIKRTMVETSVKSLAAKLNIAKSKSIKLQTFNNPIKSTFKLIKKKWLHNTSYMKSIHAYVLKRNLIKVIAYMKNVTTSATRFKKLSMSVKATTQSITSKVSTVGKFLKSVKAWARRIAGSVSIFTDFFNPTPIKVKVKHTVHFTQLNIKNHTSEAEFKTHSTVVTTKSGGGN